MRNWKNQFGEEYLVPSEITSILIDVSWGSDACPSFTYASETLENPKADYPLTLWVEHPDREKRSTGLARFTIVSREGKPILETEELATALKAFLIVFNAQALLDAQDAKNPFSIRQATEELSQTLSPTE